MRVLAVLVSLIIFSAAVSADSYYKWQDDEGMTHYTAQAPDDRASVLVNTQTGETLSSEEQMPEDENASTAVSSEEAAQHKPPPPESPEIAEPSPQEVAAARKKTKENCDAVNKNLELLNRRSRVRITDKETGEMRYLTPEEHAAMKEKAEQHVDQYCQ
ncbi:MAG: hypothetical protein DRR42_04460 [Gammaproteobacteria bacterium]|nr:MAG: hypothetical protein DRR42_04460 [Gammaproteobacteria bacterium]